MVQAVRYYSWYKFKSRDDRVSWSLSDKGFSVKSLYNKLQTKMPIKVFSKIWALKVSAKVKCFFF
jgi:hypothetical protein